MNKKLLINSSRFKLESLGSHSDKIFWSDESKSYILEKKIKTVKAGDWDWKSFRLNPNNTVDMYTMSANSLYLGQNGGGVNTVWCSIATAQKAVTPIPEEVENCFSWRTGLYLHLDSTYNIKDETQFLEEIKDVVFKMVLKNPEYIDIGTNKNLGVV